MQPLIAELVREHAFISDMLREAKKLGVRSQAGLAALISAKRGLLAHLKKEDDRLYPELRRAAERDAEVRALLLMFGRDLEEVTRVVLGFFEKYETPGARFTDLEFAKDFGQLMARLSLRLSTEEKTLYQQYERLAGGR